MKQTTKKIITIFVALLFVAAAVYTLPIPSRIDLKMTGAEVCEDDISMDRYTLWLTGWKRNYLFRDDTMKVDVQINGLPDLNLNGMYHTPIYENIPEYNFISYFVYLAKTNNLDVLTLYFDKELTWSVITVDNRQFVFSTDPNRDLLEYWKMCLD